MLFLFIIFLLLLIYIYTKISVILFVILLFFLIYLFYLSLKQYNIYLFVLSVVIFILLLPSILFYSDLCLMYPYISYVKNDIKGMKRDCCNFLDKHFNCNIRDIYHIKKCKGPVIYILNHHLGNDKMLDMLYHLKIPGNNSVVVTGGETRYEIIKNLYSNLNTVKLSKKSKGNMRIFLHKCKKKIYQGNNIVIFPEGKYTDKKRSWNKLLAFQSGAFILSKQYNIPIIPVLISGGNYEYGLIIHSDITMKYLEPLYPSNYDSIDEYRDDALQLMNLELSNI